MVCAVRVRACVRACLSTREREIADTLYSACMCMHKYLCILLGEWKSLSHLLYICCRSDQMLSQEPYTVLCSVIIIHLNKVALCNVLYCVCSIMNHVKCAGISVSGILVKRKGECAVMCLEL